MANGIFGGGLIFVVAALLWAAVLVPTWVRRREFKAAEQNALRLQRTLRVLAETAEVPTEVRVEATAREALAQERLLRTAQRRQEAERKAALAEARTAQIHAEMRAQQMKRKQAALVRAAKLRRPVVRRTRSFAALVLVLALAAALIGAGMLIAGLGSALLLGSLAAAVGSLGVLVLLAPGRAKHVEIDAERVVSKAPAREVAPVQVDIAEDRAVENHAAAQAAAAARIARARSMARARAQANSVAASAAAVRNQAESILLERAAGAAQEAESHPRESQAASRQTAASASTPQTHAQSPLQPRAQAQAPVARPASAQTRALAAEIAMRERLRQMGVVGDTSDGALDLDSVLKHRRAG